MQNQTNERFDEKQVIALFKEAVRILKRLPSTRVQGYFNAWPDVVYSEIEIIRMDKKTKTWPATAEAISRMERTIEWLKLLNTATERKIVWMRASNIPWDIISKTFGFSRVTASKKYKNSIKFITQNYPDLPMYRH